MWKENEVLKCTRERYNSPTQYVKSLEVIWFTSNQTLILGEFETVETENVSYINQSGQGINISVAEINKDSIRKILYNGQSDMWVAPYREAVSTQPILIEAQKNLRNTINRANKINKCILLCGIETNN